MVLLYLLPKREFYKNMKFKYTDTQTQVSSTRVASILPTVLSALVSLTNHWGAAKSCFLMVMCPPIGTAAVSSVRLT